MEKLKEYRAEIEKLDSEIADLLVKRMKLSKKIGNYKKENGLPVFDPQRELELKEKNILAVEQEYQRAYQEVFETILKVSKDLQL